tara:strand:- start:3325 stop:3513 length:189 start_codon:yes stop_codon:yes gene_type:complete
MADKILTDVISFNLLHDPFHLDKLFFAIAFIISISLNLMALVPEEFISMAKPAFINESRNKY